LRDVGLGLVDRVPPLKQAMIGRAAGLERGGPRLLGGRSIRSSAGRGVPWLLTAPRRPTLLRARAEDRVLIGKSGGWRGVCRVRGVRLACAVWDRGFGFRSHAGGELGRRSKCEA